MKTAVSDKRSACRPRSQIFQTVDMGLCPIAPPKGFPLALWKPSGAKLSSHAKLPAEVKADSVRPLIR